MVKLTDRELNAKLMESLNITSAEAKSAFSELMRDKVAEIRKEVRQEVFEEFSKQAQEDKKAIIESLNTVANQTIAEEKKKNDIHRKNLIKEKLALKEAKESLDKLLADKTALIQENFNKKLNKSLTEMRTKYESEKADFIEKASKFINESVKKEVVEIRNDKKQLMEALDQFGSFISNQVKEQVESHKEEMKSLDSLRVRLVKENAEKLANAKKKFFAEAAEKMEKFTNAAVAHELKEFRTDIAESRKKSFGNKIFEAFAKEFAVKFFNEDKIVKSMMESVKSSQNKLNASNKALTKQLNEANEKLSNLEKVNAKITREKIINESVAHLAKDKQDMIKNLVKEVPTNKLSESINRYIPMILSNSAPKMINKNEKVLKEGRKSTFLTGDNKKSAMNLMENADLDSDLNAEIEKVIANCKF